MSSISLDQKPGRLAARASDEGAPGRFSITFRGVRGSYAVPGPGTIGVGGNTPCVEVRAGGHILIFDAGTGIIGLGRELVAAHFASGPDAATRQPIRATLFFSHLHHDHTQGFPFFGPAYIRESILHIFGPRLVRQDLEQALIQALLNPFFPVDLEDMAAQRVIQNFHPLQAVLFAPGAPEPQLVSLVRERPEITPEHVVVRMHRGLSHPQGVCFYRVEYRGKAVVYATDTEGYVGGDVNLAQFAAGADILIHDAQYRETEYVGQPPPVVQGYGHSTPAMAAFVAASSGVGRLVLFHHDPAHSDEVVASMETDAQRFFGPCIAAREGLTLDLL